MNGFEMMAKFAMEKALENIPPETLEQITQIGQFITRLSAQLDRIEAQNRLILDKLGDDDDAPEKRRLARPENNERKPVERP